MEQLVKKDGPLTQTLLSVLLQLSLTSQRYFVFGSKAVNRNCVFEVLTTFQLLAFTFLYRN